jgi:hypothetical protein
LYILALQSSPFQTDSWASFVIQSEIQLKLCVIFWIPIL